VNNKGDVVGIECATPEQRDGELVRIRNLTAQKIKPCISVSVDFIEVKDRTVARIFVPRGDQPLYFLDHEIFVREQSTSMRATPEQVENILTKFYR